MRLILDTSIDAAWCWIGKDYPLERILFHYGISHSPSLTTFEVFVFLNCLALLLLYPLLFLRLWIKKESQEDNRELAQALLWYPVLYILCTMPLSSARLADIAGYGWSENAYFVGAGLYACEGWCNILLYTSREGVLPWSWLGFRQHIYEMLEAYHPRTAGHERNDETEMRPFPSAEIAAKEDFTSRGSAEEEYEEDFHSNSGRKEEEEEKRRLVTGWMYVPSV